MIRFIPVLFLLALAGSPSHACGYGFIGDCPTNVSLRINNTPDSFFVDYCPFGLNFQGLFLGEIQSLDLDKVTAATWESCFNNVASVSLFYRVYPEGGLPSAWNELPLEQDLSILDGPYTARHHTLAPGVNLTAGLLPGVNYRFELYYLARIDTLGDDFIPETELIHNKNGQNFQLSFRFGGSSAPPLTIVNTKIIPVECPGDSTGLAQVRVYGELDGLFYQWSYQSTNFHTLANLPAGQYMLTVSNSSGYQQIDTIVITQPLPLDVNFMVLQSVGCGGQPGLIAASGSGGTGPITYLWADGTTDSVVTVALPGIIPVTLTDSRGCTAVFAVAAPSDPPVTRVQNAEICPGQQYLFGTSLLSQAGLYSMVLPGQAGACDTVVELQLTVVPDPAPALASLPDSIALSCAFPAAALCALSLPGISYSWQLDGLPVSMQPCLEATEAGVFTLTVVATGLNIVCAARDTVVAAAHLNQPQIAVMVDAATGPTSADGQIQVGASGGQAPYNFAWTEFMSGDSLGGLLPGVYCVTVTDQAGCTADSCLTVSFTVGAILPKWDNRLRVYPNPARAGQEIQLRWEASGRLSNGRIELIGTDGRMLAWQDWPDGHHGQNFILPSTLPYGPIFLRLLSGIDVVVKKLEIISPEH